uniref:Uncharacterized protein n=1 Tax=Anguilla anguilla TaxID=7936 RepID=A0A0E9R783_ANGAN
MFRKVLYKCNDSFIVLKLPFHTVNQLLHMLYMLNI